MIRISIPYLVIGALLALFIQQATAAPSLRDVTPRGTVINEDGTGGIFTCTGACGSTAEILTDADGTTASLTAGLYRVTATVEAVFLCTGGASACIAADGIVLQPGAVEYLSFAAGNAYARSAGGAGVVYLAKATRGVAY